jgi:predicted amidophosphoribosyltransferase
MPSQKTFDQPYIPSLFFYHPDTSRSENRVIYTAKHKNPAPLFEFLAAELEPNVYALLRDTATSKEECILTWIPRDKRNERKNGVDQARELCIKLADKTGIEARPLLVRASGGREQKKLDGSRARQKNVKESVFLNKKYIAACTRGGETVLNGKTVLVIDDIITTGASMNRALSLIRSAGAEKVMACCVARSQIKSKKSTEGKAAK